METESSSILIVDDEELNSEALARRLQGRGFVVSVANSGRKAIELLGERRFDLVLLDIMMPGMSGLEVLKFLRRVDSLLDLPIVMVTARGEREDMVEALELGANDYVTKPIDFPVVLARIRTQLALRRAVAKATALEQKLGARNKELETAARERAEANERISQDLEAAARVQQAFLPVIPRAVPGARLGWVFRPCGQLAGDFLNVFRLGDRHLGLCILDVNGHGVAAALVSVAAGHLLARMSVPPPVAGRRRLGGAKATLVSPAEVARQLNKQLSGKAALGHPFTLLYGVLDLDQGEFRFVSAGHPGPVHLPADGEPTLLEVTGLPVGVGGGNYREQVLKFRPGSRLLLYTDGVTEARNTDGEHFGTRRMLAALDQTRHTPLAESLDALLRAVEQWCGDSPRHDDISMLAVEFTDLALQESGEMAGKVETPEAILAGGSVSDSQSG
jgi:sigma-B regulation protein RsbU (phosphoserine phosphatase)